MIPRISAPSRFAVARDGAAVYRSEAARLVLGVEAAADDRRRTLERVRELRAAAVTAEAVAGEAVHDPDAEDDPRAHRMQAKVFRREAAELHRSLAR